MRATSCRSSALLRIAALTLLAAVPFGSAFAGDGGIRGRVTDARTGAGVVAAQVVVRDAQGAIVAGTMCDSVGAFTLSRVPEGLYTVEASRIGYERAALRGVSVRGAGMSQANLTLDVVAFQADAVVVTSTRRVERVADTDLSVTVVQGDRAESRAEPTVFGALKRVAGLDFFSSGLGQQQPNARGFVNPFTSNLLVLVDGRLASLPGLGTVLPGVMLVAQADVAQMEVVTGPSSALFGANAANGVINIVTRDPREGEGGAISATGGDRGFARVGFRSAALLGQHFGLKVATEKFEARDFERYNVFAGSGGYSTLDAPDFNVSHETVSGSLYFYPAPGTRVVYSGGATRANYINLTVAGRLQVKDWDASYQQLRANIAHVLGGSLYANASYSGNDAGDSYYLDVLARMQIPQAAGGQGLSPAAAMQRALFIDRSDRFEFELQHTARSGDAHFLTTGVMWRTSHPVSDGTYLTDGPGGAPIRITESGAYAAYDNASIPRLRLTAVARYDTHSDFSARFSPKLSASYALPNGHTVHATYNEAFNSPNNYLLYARSLVGRDAQGLNNWIRGNRAGFTFVNTAGGPVPAPIRSLEPLHVSSIEMGYRASWNANFALDLTAYQSIYRNYISKEAAIGRASDSVFALDPKTGQPLRENTRTYLNYGELPVTGADLSLEWLPSSRWSAEASFGYQEPGTFRKPVAGLAPPGFNAPTHKGKVSLAYRDWWRRESRVEIAAIRVSRFEFVSSLPYLTGTVPEYTVADLNATVPVFQRGTARTRLALSLKNLFDERHIEVPGGAELRRVVSLTLSAEW